jgi:hypothetical protein
MRAYVDSGNNIECANDIKRALHYMGGIKGRVSVIAITKEITELSASKIPNISQYHSIQFDEDGMTFWPYFNIGVGEKITYGSPSFTPKLEVIQPFTLASATPTTIDTGVHMKQRSDRGFREFHVCPDVACLATFENEHELDEHILGNVHNYIQPRTSEDRVKLAYAKRMHSLTGQIENEAQTTKSENATQKPRNPNEEFEKEGWALPTRKKTRFSLKQKGYLYDLFMNGEETGRKIRPEEAVRKMQRAEILGGKIFSPTEYLTTDQVRSLFSRMSSLNRQGKLQDPRTVPKTSNADDFDDRSSSEPECDKVGRNKLFCRVNMYPYHSLF